MQGGLLTKVFFIRTGKVKIFKMDATGRKQIISILEAGKMFPHAGFFREGVFPAYAKIVEEAQIVTIPIDKFEEVLLANPEICMKLFKLLGEKIVDLQQRLEEQILHNTHEQIILLLLRLVKSNGIIKENEYKITTHFTNRELANMIGTTRETVSRTINHLKKEQIIKTDEDGYFIIKPVLSEMVHY
jgi:CRP/FNR family transcriptional regulator